MSHIKLFGRAAVVAALLCGTSAQAQITAEEVWKGWVDYYASMGQTVTTGSEERQGDTLVVTDAKLGMQAPDGSSFTISVDEVRLKELGDGRVEIVFPPEIPMSMIGKTAAGEDMNMAMKVTNTGMSMIASGTAADTGYAFSAPELGIAVDSATVNGTAVPLVVDFKLTNNSGNYKLSTTGGRVLVSDFASEKMVMNISAQDPESGGNFAMAGEIAGLAGLSNASLPEGIDLANMSAAMAAGMKVDGTFSYTGANYKIDATDPASGPMTGTVTDGGGAINFAMSKDGMNYGGGSKGVSLSFSGGGAPFPIDASFAEAAFNLAMPVSKSDADQPFGFLLKLVDLKISDQIWGMFDPGSQLPRDPATVVVDVAGTGKLAVDLLDPAMQAPGATMPDMAILPSSLNINALQVKAVGADLTGDGAMTFDNSGGVPMPLGEVNLQLTGGNALIDKMVAAGFIPEDQAMGARMMLGMFAVPSGDDVLTSKIEFKEGGSIFANGQQIQ